MSDGNSSASVAIRQLYDEIHARLVQNEDFRALNALKRALAEVTQGHLSRSRQLQASAQALTNFDAPASPPAPSIDSSAQVSTEPQSSAASASFRALADDTLPFGEQRVAGRSRLPT